MREAIRGNQRQSEEIRGSRLSGGGLTGHFGAQTPLQLEKHSAQRRLVQRAARIPDKERNPSNEERNPRSSERPSEALRSPRRHSEALRCHQRQTAALRGHRTPSDAIGGNQRPSAAHQISRSATSAYASIERVRAEGRSTCHQRTLADHQWQSVPRAAPPDQLVAISGH